MTAPGDAPNAATIELVYRDGGGADLARVVATSLRQDVGEIDDDRSRTAVERDGATVRVAVGAADRVALRAALNTWLSLASVAERVAGAASRSR